MLTSGLELVTRDARLANDGLQCAYSEFVVPGCVFCMTIWLPRWRASTKPCRAGMAHASLPERTRSLLNGDVNLRDIDLLVEVFLDFRR